MFFYVYRRSYLIWSPVIILIVTEQAYDLPNCECTDRLSYGFHVYTALSTN